MRWRYRRICPENVVQQTVCVRARVERRENFRLLEQIKLVGDLLSIDKHLFVASALAREICVYPRNKVSKSFAATERRSQLTWHCCRNKINSSRVSINFHVSRRRRTRHLLNGVASRNLHKKKTDIFSINATVSVARLTCNEFIKQNTVEKSMARTKQNRKSIDDQNSCRHREIFEFQIENSEHERTGLNDRTIDRMWWQRRRREATLPS